MRCMMNSGLCPSLFFSIHGCGRFWCRDEISSREFCFLGLWILVQIWKIFFRVRARFFV